jgi:hypothetical protein
MKKEIEKEINENSMKEPNIEKNKNSSYFYPINENEQTNSRINYNIINLQKSGVKNLKNEMKSEAASAFM